MEGTPFGRYRLIEMLGEGGMGHVWRAFDTGTSRVVALKVLPLHLASDATFEQRFRREALAAASMNNPHIVPIHDFGEIDGRLFVNMRLVNGMDLKTALDSGPMPPNRAVAIIDQVAKALHAAHAINLIHRDVKPSNILLDDDDFAYLIDFGIARVMTETGLTGTGATIGTWAYMAPERFSTGIIDARSDVYSLACVLHECLTAHRPYSGNSFEQLIAGHLFTPPPRPSEVTAGVPRAFDDVIATGMAKDPDHRFATAGDLAASARAALSDARKPMPPLPPAQQRQPANRPPTPQVSSFNPSPSSTRPARNHTSAPPMSTDTADAPPPPNVHSGEPIRKPVAASPIDPTRLRASLAGPTPRRPDSSGGKNQRPLMIAGAAAVAVAVIVLAVLINRDPSQDKTDPGLVQSNTGGVRTSPMSIASQTSVPKPAYGPMVALPFVGMDNPAGLAVDRAGTLFAVDWGHGRVLKLAPGGQPEELVTGLGQPGGVAVDDAGTVYIAEWAQNRVVKLPPGTTTPIKVPIAGLNYPGGLAVDGAGTVYVADTWNSRIVKVPAGTGQTVEVPFTGLDRATAVAVDASGNVYAADTFNDRVVMLAAGKSQQTELPFTVGGPRAIAVDTDGAVYVPTSGAVLKLAPGQAQPTQLAMSGLQGSQGLAVDSMGNVYASEWTDDGRVLKLPKN